MRSGIRAYGHRRVYRYTKGGNSAIALGPEKSANIFKHLKEDEIEELTLEIANTRSVSPKTKEDVLEEFYQVCLAQQYIGGRRYRIRQRAAGQGVGTGEGAGGYCKTDRILTGTAF